MLTHFKIPVFPQQFRVSLLILSLVILRFRIFKSKVLSDCKSYAIAITWQRRYCIDWIQFSDP